jgi:acyl dehydratase
MEFFEDIAVGAVDAIGSHTFTAEEIKRFATAFDPQPFHMNESEAAKSHFGGLVASGWHSQAVWMRLNVKHWERRRAERAAAGAPLARIGPSPGFDSLKWLKPVFAGDTISFVNEVIGKKPSRSMPQWGLVSFQMRGHNQAREEVISFVGHVFVERRDTVSRARDEGEEAVPCS